MKLVIVYAIDLWFALLIHDDCVLNRCPFKWHHTLNNLGLESSSTFKQVLLLYSKYFLLLHMSLSLP